MRKGTRPQDIFYWTKDDNGNVIPFNFNIDRILHPHRPQGCFTPYFHMGNPDVWCCYGMIRKIEDIARTEKGAKRIKYPNS